MKNVNKYVKAREKYDKLTKINKQKLNKFLKAQSELEVSKINLSQAYHELIKLD